ncbi:GNAT family N-acetyltransferase [Paucibacter sp. B2R-40]|uniref:GNAT family N-acetyltransferase n=1 Tax=Paucibacter sp. B2R-40 TaxID=2893554 RepID=UPI0021E4358E|nr:GNAT family N-acetyltransferase [Paucibacter sp. B2R-40]MCV2353104.1 GNAT family N-acetyltransferase [Paucibacter sp. B2R-40]
MATIQIRPYLASDRQACLAIFRSNMPRYFDSSELPEFDAFLEQPSGDYFVVEQGSAVVGCGGCYIREGKGRLSWGMVARDCHGAALGASLLAWRVNHLFLRPETAEITIDTSQHTAGFFARYGFRTTQQISDGFGPGIDQISMSLQRDDWQPEN